MTKHFTQSDLVRFLYHECSDDEANEMAFALESDSDLNTQFKSMQAVYSELSTFRLKPSARVVDEILNYSASAALEAQY